ncbi:unnamed protein product [Closterium sp. NIES-53]
MPVALGDDYPFPYSPRPFGVASVALASPLLSPLAEPVEGMSAASSPAPVTGSMVVNSAQVSPGVPVPETTVMAPVSLPAVALLPAAVLAPPLAMVAASPPAPPTVALPLSAAVPAVMEAVAKAPAPAEAPPHASAAGPHPVARVAELTALAVASPDASGEKPAPPPAASPLSDGAAVPSTRAAPLFPQSDQRLPDPQRQPPSPGRRPSRPHSPLPRGGRESSRRWQESPQRRQSQANWPAHRGRRGGWKGGHGRGRGGTYQAPLTPADIRQIVRAAMHEERAEAASHSTSQRALPSPVIAPPVAYPVAAPPTAALVPAPLAPACGGGPSSAAGDPLPSLAEALLPPQIRVPEATLGHLWRLAESLRAFLLVQALVHASLPSFPAGSLMDGPRDDCLDAADQLASLLAPVLAAPVQGGVGAMGQLDAVVWGLRRCLRAGSGADVIGASRLVVREVWRSLTGIRLALQANRK